MQAHEEIGSVRDRVRVRVRVRDSVRDRVKTSPPCAVHYFASRTHHVNTTGDPR